MVPAAAGAPGRAALVGCGHAWLDTRVRDRRSRDRRTPCPPGRGGGDLGGRRQRGAGLLEAAGRDRARPSARGWPARARGRSCAPATSASSTDGELFVTGRLKDLLIFRGRNHYPQDIELTAERSPSGPAAGARRRLRRSTRDGEERLVVACEVERGARRAGGGRRRSPRRRCASAVAEEHELRVAEVVLLLEPGSLPKTSSGKVQRHACKKGFRQGSSAWSGPRIAADQAAAGRGDGGRAGGRRRAAGLGSRRAAAVGCAAPLGRAAGGAGGGDRPRASRSPASASTRCAPWRSPPRCGAPRPAGAPTLAYEHPTLDELVRHLTGRAEAAPSPPPRRPQPRRANPSARRWPSSAWPAGSPARRTSSPSGACWRAHGRHHRGAAPGAGMPPPSTIRRRDPGRSIPPLGRVPRRASTGFDAELLRHLRRARPRPMDPQQRLLLEVAWRLPGALGHRPGQLAGSATGVFVGISSLDFARLAPPARRRALGLSTGTGTAAVDCRQPAVLRARPARAEPGGRHRLLVVAGRRAPGLPEPARAASAGPPSSAGVNVSARPGADRRLRTRAGCCRRTAAARPSTRAADGYVPRRGRAAWSCCKRLADARARRRPRSWRVVRGTAVNQDGRSNGLTAPNARAQAGGAARARCAPPACDPARVDYVEAHGTGTPARRPDRAGGAAARCSADRSRGAARCRSAR